MYIKNKGPIIAYACIIWGTTSAFTWRVWDAHKKPNLSDRFPGPDLNPGPLKYESRHSTGTLDVGNVGS
jgi:hypothetical protein